MMRMIRESRDNEAYENDILDRVYDLIDEAHEFEYRVHRWEDTEWKYRDEQEPNFQRLFRIVTNYSNSIELIKDRLEELGVKFI